MDSRQSKEILACYRPGRDDPGDPQFAEALEHARRDPELTRWLEQQTALDAALREKLKQIPVPAELREKIISQLPARPVVIAWWQQPAFRATATALVLLAAVAGFWLAKQRYTFGAYRQQMAGLVSGEYDMSLKSKDLNEIRDYLSLHGWPSDYALTPAMQKLEAEGGGIINWHGQRVSLVCLDAGEDNDLFLFIVHRSILPDAPPTESPQFAKVGRMMTASWSAGDKLYLLAGHGDEQFLRQYL